MEALRLEGKASLPSGADRLARNGRRSSRPRKLKPASRLKAALLGIALGGAACTGFKVCDVHSGTYQAHGGCGPDATVSVGYDNCDNAFTGAGSEAAGLPQLGGTLNPATVLLPDGGPPLLDGGLLLDDAGMVMVQVRECSLTGDADAGWAVHCSIYDNCFPDAGCAEVASCDSTLSP